MGKRQWYVGTTVLLMTTVVSFLGLATIATGTASADSANTHSSVIVRSSSSLQTTTTTATKMPLCHATSKVVCVTASDLGKTVKAKVGQTVEFTLQATGQRFSALEDTTTGVLRFVSSTDYVTEGTYFAKYTAVKTGRGTLQGTEAPMCEKDAVCPMYILLWRVTISVSK